eukprot:7385200-Prymnesium_polylepis.1
MLACEDHIYTYLFDIIFFSPNDDQHSPHGNLAHRPIDLRGKKPCNVGASRYGGGDFADDPKDFGGLTYNGKRAAESPATQEAKSARAATGARKVSA